MTRHWQARWTAPVGGLTDVGFSTDERFLLVVGHAGRGVFDCETGERVGRDPRDDWTYFNEAEGVAQGIGPLEGQAIRLAGLMADRALPQEVGGCRASATDDGAIIVDSNGAQQMVKENEEVKALGFSNSGRWLVFAASSGVTVMARGDGDGHA